MPIVDCIIALYCYVEEHMKEVPGHSQEKLSPAELVTLGILYALKGTSQSQFHRWIAWNYRFLFPQLPERTRLFRRLTNRQRWTDRFLADSSLLAIADAYGIETVHPRREGRDERRIAGKGPSNHRWIVGIKVCPLVNHLGRVVDFAWSGANLHDKHFRPLIARYGESAVLTDSGFHGKEGDPENLNVCQRGQCNARFLVETVFSLWTRFMSLKKITEQRMGPLAAHVCYAMAAFNIVQEILASEPDENGMMPLKMVGICL